MANITELTPNALERAHRRNQLAGTLTAGTAIIGGWLLGLDFWGLAATPTLYGAFIDGRLPAGADGEKRALGLPKAEPGALATLPDDYTLFNNLRVPWNGKTVEIDLLAIGTNGVFIIEVKNYRGHLTGSGSGQRWIQQKTSSDGQTYTNSLRNPVGQVWRQILALREWLGRGGYRGSIEGLVVCTHPEVALNVDSGKIPVLTVPELAGWIHRFKPKFPQHSPHLPVLLLRHLRDGRPLATPDRQATPLDFQQRWARDQSIDRAAAVLRASHEPGPRHISEFMARVVARAAQRRRTTSPTSLETQE